MKQLFAPWRMKYIQDAKQKGCIFCDLPKQGVLPESLVLYRGKAAFVVLNRYPYISGHLMVVPYLHVGSPLMLPADAWQDTMSLVRDAVGAVERVYRPQGFNIGMNVGRPAGAGIDEHVHVHVVPRWNGDTNFVPVLSETRVIPEALEDTFQRLFPEFSKLKEGS